MGEPGRSPGEVVAKRRGHAGHGLKGALTARQEVGERGGHWGKAMREASSRRKTSHMHTCTPCFSSCSSNCQGAQCQAWPCEGLCRCQDIKATLWWSWAVNDQNLSHQPVSFPSYVRRTERKWGAQYSLKTAPPGES